MFMSKFRKGFTLAEVLITLLIIGVVASLVIPSLIGDTQSAELKVGLKKAVASVNQALAMSIAQDATDASVLTGAGTNSGRLMNIFSSKLNVIKTDMTGTLRQLTTADGAQFNFYAKSAACDDAASGIIDITAAQCYILVDVNGTKKPNTLSIGSTFKDQYYLIVRQKQILAGLNNGNALAQQAMYQ